MKKAKYQQAQLMKYKGQCLAHGVGVGLRVNPECSTQGDHAIYDPCAPGSRLGVTIGALEKALANDATVLDDVSGLHFHTLCEQGFEPCYLLYKIVVLTLYG